ncbi:Gfo/Idh/MocA family protein [Paenibacillus sp. LPE1-1-1.1]|uniref:Gfo/Idh/MocA family protein n=1 Tax=Paenibacillus sp. LPE1-1-1.1 TaxID=3135230 RepID=UPI00342ADC13
MNIGFIGCGIISMAHLEGLEELKRANLKTFDLTAVCDLNEKRANAFAANAEERLGKRPKVYTDYKKMIAEEPLDAASVLLDHDLHHIVAEDCFAAGIHVQMQKPLAISPFYGRKILADAKKYDRILTVSEPSVLGAENIAMARAIKDGIIGPVHLLMDYATVTLNRAFFAGTAWRHFKGRAGAGWINDHGVHRTQMFTEVNGPIREVFAYTEIFEKELTDGKTTIRPTGEDTSVTVFRFDNGGLGHWMCSTAAHGESAGGVWIYGSNGCFRPGKHIALGNGQIIPIADVIKQYAPEAAAHPFAHSYVELWEAITDRKTPISSGERGFEALCIVFAALESALIGQPVKVREVMDGVRHSYEDTVVNEMIPDRR